MATVGVKGLKTAPCHNGATSRRVYLIVNNNSTPHNTIRSYALDPPYPFIFYSAIAIDRLERECRHTGMHVECPRMAATWAGVQPRLHLTSQQLLSFHSSHSSIYQTPVIISSTGQFSHSSISAIN